MEVLIKGSPLGLLDYKTITVFYRGSGVFPFTNTIKGRSPDQHGTINSGALGYCADSIYLINPF